MITLCWLLSGLTGFVPVFTGIYSSSEHLDLIRKNSQDCGDLVVNKYFSVFAGIVSFWMPASIMVYVYFKVAKFPSCKSIIKSGLFGAVHAGILLKNGLGKFLGTFFGK